MIKINISYEELVEGKEISIELWTFLNKNPLKTKVDFPDIAKLKKYYNYNFFCHLFKCECCPIKIVSGSACRNLNSWYDTWKYCVIKKNENCSKKYSGKVLEVYINWDITKYKDKINV